MKKKIFPDPPLRAEKSIYMGGWVVGGSREVADGAYCVGGEGAHGVEE